jgi:hypothetical protein
MEQDTALAAWIELQRLISVGAYEERSNEHYLTGTWPEDGVEESLFNLENWAARQGLEFCFNHDTNSWSLEPIEYEEYDPEEYDEEEMERRWCEYHQLYHWPCF